VPRGRDPRRAAEAAESCASRIRSLPAADASEPAPEDCPTCHTYGRDPACLDHDEHRVGDVWEKKGRRCTVVHVEARPHLTFREEGREDVESQPRHAVMLGWRRVQRKGEP
jgi:hypothetical protein